MNENIDNFIEDFCAKQIRGKQDNTKPLCILLGGLPGSGKTNLIKRVQEEYNNSSYFVVIDADDYRKLHPNYKTLLQTPEIAIAQTSELANAIEGKLIENCIETHCNFISVSTLRATEDIDKKIYIPALKSGYKMQIGIMAVSIIESGLSAQIRYENQIANGECPRFTPMSFIESSYEEIKNTIRMLQNKTDAPIIKVYSRGKGKQSLPIEIYNSQQSQNKYSCALEAFYNPVQLINKQEAIEQINKLYHIKKSRAANDIEYESLKRLEELLDRKKDLVR